MASLRECLQDRTHYTNSRWLYSKFDEVNENFVNFTPSKTEATEELALWAQRANRTLDDAEDELQITQIDGLLKLIIDRWTAGDPAYKMALLKCTKEFLILRDKLYGEDQLASLIHHAISFSREEPRITFGVLEAFAKSSKTNRGYLNSILPSSFFTDAFQRLSEQSQRGGMVGKCLASILVDTDPSIWYSYTQAHLATSGVTTYFLEPILKQHPTPVAAFESFFSLSRNSDRSVVIGILRAGKNANLDVSNYVLDSPEVAAGLAALSKPERFGAFNLLCSSTRKLTLPIPSIVFDLIRKNAVTLFGEGDPQSRADIIGGLRHLLLRIETSSKRHPETKEEAREFLDFLIDWAADSLQPGMPYRNLAMSIRILDLLNKHRVEYLNPRVTFALINCVTSEFADIRECAVTLLDKPSELTSVNGHYDQLLNLSFDLLDKNRSGDAGARLLEFLKTKKGNAFGLGDEVSKRLMAVLQAASDKLLHAAESESLYGYFIALRLVSPTTSTLPAIYETWRVCTPPLMNSAPEGVKEEVTNFCWKAVKESCALLETLAASKPNDINDTDRLLTEMARILTGITHWGAFSAVPPAYVGVARLNVEKSHELMWSYLLSLKQKKSTRSVTRRSAGLPLLITSSLTVRFDPAVVEELFGIAQIPLNPHEEAELELPQVHGMNCLRAVLTDAYLAKESATYIEPALRLAFEQFTSPSWSLRNCAAMLFSTLSIRLFGVGVKPMAASLLFQKYKSIRPALIDELEGTTKDSELHAVYPALSILALLQVGPRDDHLDSFWVPVLELLGARNWKIREMAARAVAAMSHELSAWDIIHELIFSLDGRDQNLMHGFGLAMNEILRAFPFAIRSTSSDSLALDSARLVSLISNNVCMETNVELLKVLGSIDKTGVHRILWFDGLPKYQHLNPSVATFEAEQVRQSLHRTEQEMKLFTRYASRKWTPVLRVLPYSVWRSSPNLCMAVLHSSDMLPDVRAIALQAWEAVTPEKFIINEAFRLLQPFNPSILRQNALVVAAACQTEDSKEWAEALKEFSVDAAPVESRRTSVKAIEVYLKGAGSDHSKEDQSILDEALYALFRLLSDEEEDIRNRAAAVACSYASASEMAPAACERLVLSAVSSSYISQQLGHNLIRDVEVARSNHDDPRDVLFVIEKENLFRDDLRSVQLQGHFCDPEDVAEADAILSGLSWDLPLQAGSNSELLEVKTRIDALSGKWNKKAINV